MTCPFRTVPSWRSRSNVDLDDRGQVTGVTTNDEWPRRCPGPPNHDHVAGRASNRVVHPAGGGSGSGTWLWIGLIVRRYANTDFRSSSVRLRYTDQGMGGRMGRATPQWRPVRMVLMNVSS